MASNRYNGNVVPFADNATGSNRTVFGDTNLSDNIDDNLNDDYKLGWEIVGINDSPTKQDFNALGYTQGKLISHLYQQGISEYNVAQEYYVNSLVMGSNGVVYQSLSGTEGSPNVGNNPITDDANWKLQSGTGAYVIDTVDDFGTVPSGIDTVIVKDINRGGTFIYDDTQSAVNNGGTIFDGWVRQFSGAVNVKWFGAKGDGSIETAILNYALQTSKAIGAAEIDFGSGRYETDAELIIPDNIIVNLNKCTIHANHLSGNILKTIHNATGKPVITLIGNRATIEGSGFAGTDSLVGLWIDTCNFSRFSGLVFTNFNGNSVILGATGQRDIISFAIDNIETNTGSGLKMLTGYIGGVQYSNITTGSVRDCFWSCIGAGNVGFEATAALKQDLSESSLYGINFERCSFNPTNPNYGTMISMSAISPGVIREITFHGCEGETRTTTPVSPLVYLHRVVNSKFNLTGYLLNSEGIRLVDCHNNIFDNLTFPMTNPSDTSTFLSIDVNSADNIFNNYNILGNQISTAYGYNAPLSGYVWDNIIDYGKNTTFNGQITSRIKRVFDESYLDLLTSAGKSIYPSIPDTGTTWSKASGLYYGSATTATMLEFNVPTYIPIGTLVTFRIKYRFTSDISAEPAKWRFGISVDGTLQGPTIPMNTTWTDYMVSAVITGRKTRIYTSSYTQPVTMQFEKIEIFIGGYPYIPNYTPVDDKNIFLNNPYCTTASRPYYGKEIGFSIFDTTLNKQITWNGTVWKDGSGTTV